MIAGGGETGYHLAQALDQDRFTVLLMESDRKRSEHLAAGLKHVTVVQCDAKIARLLGKPAQFLEGNAVHSGDNSFVENENFFEVLLVHVTYDCGHRASVGVLAGTRKTIDLEENFE